MKKQYPDEFLYGLHVGEHGFIPENILTELKTNCRDRGMNFVTIRPARETALEPSLCFAWADYCAKNHIYFVFLYTLQWAPKGQKTKMTEEIVTGMKKIAGKYFLGDMLGETGSLWIGKEPGYFPPNYKAAVDLNVSDAQTAQDNYIKAMRRLIEIEQSVGMDRVGIASVDATIANTYNIEAGVDTPFTELLCGDPQPVIAALRGAARGAGIDFWGTYVAHEWYAGMHHEDILKRKRLELAYKYAYMHGTRAICHESGDDGIDSYGRTHPADGDICLETRRFIDSFGAFTKEDKRPAGDPTVKIAFLQGNADSWLGGWGGSSVWGQMGREGWGSAEPEWSWRILDEIGVKQKWHVPESYAGKGHDLSALPPYGSFDILPASAPAEVMSHYDVLIAAGWNTMTEDQITRLERFVEAGGTLLMGAAHLNTNAVRGGEYVPIRSGDVSRLFGCRLTGKSVSSNLGCKFNAPGIDGMLYPYAKDRICDPIFSNGYADYAEIELCGGQCAAYLENSFANTGIPGTPVLVENNLGKGHALLMTTLRYPGCNAVYPMYRFLVRELMRTHGERASVRVLGPDSLRYTVYESGDLYLLNTDYDLPILVRILTADGGVRDITLESLELKHIQL